MSTQPLLLYDPLLFLLIYLNHIRLHKTLSYHSYSLYLFTLLILKFIDIFMHITMCLYITITILLWVLSIYPFIKHYTIVILSQPYNLVICVSLHQSVCSQILFRDLSCYLGWSWHCPPDHSQQSGHVMPPPQHLKQTSAIIKFNMSTESIVVSHQISLYFNTLNCQISLIAFTYSQPFPYNVNDNNQSYVLLWF